MAHEGQHEDCFGCKVKTIQLSPKATPTRKRRSIPKPKQDTSNSWERGIVKDERGMPVLDGGQQVGVKQWANGRAKYDRRLKEAKAKQKTTV